MGYLFLAIAIVAEVIGTSSLKASEAFTKPLPSLLVVLGYGTAFYFLSLVVKTVPVGIAYAIWSGVGIVLVAIVAAVLFKQIPDWPSLVGMLLIIVGVVVIQLSQSAK